MKTIRLVPRRMVGPMRQPSSLSSSTELSSSRRLPLRATLMQLERRAGGRAITSPTSIHLLLAGTTGPLPRPRPHASGGQRRRPTRPVTAHGNCFRSKTGMAGLRGGDATGSSTRRTRSSRS